MVDQITNVLAEFPSNKDEGISFEVVKETSHKVSLTGEQLAELFWNMGTESQAQFFNYLGDIPVSKFTDQMHAVSKEESLSNGARAAMDVIGEYSEGEITRDWSKLNLTSSIDYEHSKTETTESQTHTMGED